MDSNADDTSYWELGQYTSTEAAKLFSAFEAAGIDFRMDILLLSHGGQINIRVDPDRHEEAGKIHTNLFGDCLPNYDSTFFAEQAKNTAFPRR